MRPDLGWKERSDVNRDLMYKKNYELAYKISSNHSLASGPEFAEAEWLSGWLALSFLKSPSVALDHFKNFYSNVGYPISLARGAYWIGRSLEDLEEIEESKIYYLEKSFPFFASLIRFCKSPFSAYSVIIHKCFLYENDS